MDGFDSSFMVLPAHSPTSGHGAMNHSHSHPSPHNLANMTKTASTTTTPTTQTTPTRGAVNNDVAKQACRLLGIIEQCKHVAIALAKLKDTYQDKLNITAASDLQLIIKAVSWIHHAGQKKTTRVG